jgi:predicted NBD/HSP70 family sugar kinase
MHPLGQDRQATHRRPVSREGITLRNGTTISGQGSNSLQVRRHNERLILALLRRFGTASKADLARHANLTANTVGQIVQDLENATLVRSDGKRHGERGQPATLLCLDPHGACAIGVKVGRRSLDTILVDFTGQVITQCHRECPFPLPEHAVATLVDDIAAVRGALATAERSAPLAGLGIATPYNLGCWRRELDIPSEAYRAWNDFDLAARLAAETGLPTLLENDGTAAVVAELFLGRGRELNDFLYLFIGSAAGGGVVIGGDYHRGAHGNAGDLGLMPTLPSRLATAPDPTGRYEILLTRASVSALIRHLRSSGTPVATRAELDAAIAAHPALVDEWLDDSADALVEPLLAAACVLDVEAVVLDGDLPRPLLENLVERLHRVTLAAAPEARQPPPIGLGQIGRQAAALGAAILPLYINYGPSRDASSSSMDWAVGPRAAAPPITLRRRSVNVT